MDAANGSPRRRMMKEAALRTIDAKADELLRLSHTIHANPELGFEEERSSRWVADALSDGGLTVQTGVCDLPTALSASAGSGPLVIAICAEYDALPGIGHACGHNVIASAAVGAGLALAPLADELGITVKVLGTPAEEGGGGKILMLERGAFSGVGAAMMVHPAPFETLGMSCLAVSQFDFDYEGKAAHASAYPEQGVNAADAITVAQVAIGLIRQHLPAGDQVHGIVTRGGEAPNVVPAYTTARYYVRSKTLESLSELEPKVIRCFEAGALATGASLSVQRVSRTYSQFDSNRDMEAVYKANVEALGRQVGDVPTRVMRGSTDMANVSLVLPAIHPMLGIDSWPAINHQPEFADACVTPAADKAVRDGAAAMAWTVIDLATEGALRSKLESPAG